MKKLLLVFVSVMLLGPNVYAQKKTILDFPGANAIVEDVERCVKAKGKFENYVEENRDNVYSEKNVCQLLEVSKLDNLTLAERASYISMVNRIIAAKEFLKDRRRPYPQIDYTKITQLRDVATSRVNNAPVKHLVERVRSTVDQNAFNYIKDIEAISTLEQIKITLDLLAMYKGKTSFATSDLINIIGTARDEYFDSLLQTYLCVERDMLSTIDISQDIKDLKLMVICDNGVDEIIAATGGISLEENHKGMHLITFELTVEDFIPNNALVVCKASDAVALNNRKMLRGLDHFNNLKEVMNNW